MSDKVTQHTQEPWFVWNTAQISNCNGELQADGTYKPIGEGGIIADLIDSDFIPAINEANARRIVACVNACAGIDTDVLEQIGTLVKSNADALNIINKFKEIQ